jgi:hypothetical protein
MKKYSADYAESAVIFVILQPIKIRLYGT